ncbi:MAG: type I glyceraldehyde-3-phosphate dehydrogenase [Candidatus Paceibacterota bacterium]
MTKKTHRIAINGFGRIGRAFFRLAQQDDSVVVVAINDLAPLENLAYLLKYDSVYGRFPFSISVSEDGAALIIDDQPIPYLSEKSPENLPWDEHEVDVVVESTGFFTDYKDAAKHVVAGAKRVVISAPAKGESEKGVSSTVLMGVNENELETTKVTSNASCTTNAGGGVIAVLHEMLGIERAMLNTVHAYTSSQDIVDGPNKKPRRGRAAAQNIVPSSTGAAEATTKVITDLAGKFDGIALRVPVVCGSIADITFVPKTETTVDEVNGLLRAAAGTEQWKNVFAVTDEPLVSSDIIGQPYAAIVDLSMTRVVDGKLVKVMAWYDNEMGYSHTLLEHVKKAAENV